MPARGLPLALFALVGVHSCTAFLSTACVTRIPLRSALSVCMSVDGVGQSASRGSVSRRGLLALAPVVAVALHSPNPASAVEMVAPLQDGDVVVNGEMRLEVGSDKKMAKVGGKALATVILRCVGKGIIGSTSLEIDVNDFPTPGQPKPGESGGVPFEVNVSDLVEKTEKGRIVNRELWGNDDIFVRVEVTTLPADGKKPMKILTGIGKAKYAVQDGKGVRQKPLVLLE